MLTAGKVCDFLVREPTSCSTNFPKLRERYVLSGAFISCHDAELVYDSSRIVTEVFGKTTELGMENFVFVSRDGNNFGCGDGLLFAAFGTLHDGFRGGIDLCNFTNDLDTNPAFAAPSEHGGNHDGGHYTTSEREW